MKPLLRILLLTLAVPIQTHLFSLLPFPFPFDLILVVTFYTGYFRGKTQGMLVGAYLGILTDILSGELLGTQMFLKTIIGYVAAVFGFGIFSKDLGIHALLLLFISLMNGFLNLFLLHLFSEGIPWGVALTSLILPAAFWNTLIGTLGMALMRKRALRRQVLSESDNTY
jgi:rod shape-determining protein MreD